MSLSTADPNSSAVTDATTSVRYSYCDGAGLAVRLKPHRTMSASKRGSAR